MQHAPPRWLERTLMYCLPVRDRETISGDLLEEFREEQVPRVGLWRANIWYLRQLISFLSVRSLGESPMKAALTCLSAGTVGIGVWLVMMEQVLKHAGHAGRAAIATCIALEGLSTLLLLMLNGRFLFRAGVSLGAVGLVLLGAYAIERNLQARHFEGFVLLIGTALVVQGLFTLIVLLVPSQTKLS